MDTGTPAALNFVMTGNKIVDWATSANNTVEAKGTNDTITSNSIQCTYDCIDLNTTNPATVSGNQLSPISSSHGKGIELENQSGAESSVITQNTVTPYNSEGCLDGIQVDDPGTSETYPLTIIGNQLSGCTTGIAWPGSAQTNLPDAFILGNTNYAASLPKASGGTGITYGSPRTYLLTSAYGTSFTPDSGTTWMVVCAYGPGGGGGACTSGTSGSGYQGGGVGAGAMQCGVYQSPSGTYTVAYGTGGSAGTCATSPVAATGPSTPTTFGTVNTNGQVYGFYAGSGAGATATASANGTGGTGASAISPTNQGSSSVNLTVFIATAGQSGHTGNGDLDTQNGAYGAGAPGGTGCTVTTGGVCDKAGTTGGNGFVTVTEYFN